LTSTSFRVLGVLALVATAVGFSAMRVWESSGRGSFPLPWSALAGMLVIAAAVLVFGWPVRRWNDGQRDRRLDPLRAARTAVLAKASSHSGALLVGWYLGQALVVLPDVAVEPRRERLVLCVLAVLAAGTMVVAGLVAEGWCRLRDDDEEW
jgi:hypothetical protein